MLPQNISVLALGTWGTALAHHLAQRGHSVLGWSNLPEVVQGVSRNRRHPHCFPEIELHSNLSITDNLAEAMQRPIVLMAFPSSALGEMVPKLTPAKDTLMISVIKDFEERSFLTPLQFAKKTCGDQAAYAVLSGPSFAKDIIKGGPAGVVAAADSEAIAKQVADLFMGGNLRVYTSNDPLGVEIGGAVKNVIALAVGICDGMNLGDSARAGLVTRGLAEMVRLATALGADPRTLFGLSGMGDLVMTATCDTSRNRTCGLKLGQGEKLSGILREIGTAVEGVHTTPLVLELAKRNNVDMPITMQVAKVLCGELTPEEAVRALITRPMKKEVE